ncbi:MAG: hypothetical protein WCR95_05730 [Eubacteriales bacterium]
MAYLTPNRAYALFYIIDKEINWVTCGVKEDGIVHYDERFKNQTQKLYAGKSGYLYKCETHGLFSPGKTRGIVVSESPVKVAGFEFIPDVYSQIQSYEKAGDIVINRYESLTGAEKKEVFDMMVHYILKNFGGEFSSALNAKEVFIKTNFPDAWDYAKAYTIEK